MKLLLTGSTGFIGKLVLQKLKDKNTYSLKRLSRNSENEIVLSLTDSFALKEIFLIVLMLLYT